MAVCLSMAATAIASQTLDECQRMARDKYPLIKRYGMIEKTTAANVSNAGKAWLPQVQAQAQASLQNDVAELPDMLTTMMRQNGYNLKGLKKDQYRVSIDVTQTVWDGGATGRQQDVARMEGQVQTAQTDVAMHELRSRVNELYFGLLLTDDRIELNRDKLTLLSSNLEKLEAMLRGGTAMECDVAAMEAEKLRTEQQHTELQSTRNSLLRSLSALCGQTVTAIEKPAADISMGINQRPELRLADTQLRLADARERLLTAGLRPRLSIFAQGYYGYPGYNMFNDMMHHDWSLNGMIGARLTWAIGAFYTLRNDRSLIQQQREQAENEREVFLFNNGIQQTELREEINKYGRLMAEDERIVELRRKVRMATEAKLRGGIIDTDRLLQEITRENEARTEMSSHEIEMLRRIYDLRYALGE